MLVVSLFMDSFCSFLIFEAVNGLLIQNLGNGKGSEEEGGDWVGAAGMWRMTFQEFQSDFWVIFRVCF